MARFHVANGRLHGKFTRCYEFLFTSRFVDKARIGFEGQTRRVLIITLGASMGTSANLFTELGRVVAQRHECRDISISLTGKSLPARAASILWSNVKHLRDVVWAQVVIGHVPAVLSLPLLIVARMTGRKLVIFQWDVYPVTIAGQTHVTGMVRRVMQQLERLCLRLADVIVLPSEDFRAASPAAEPVILPLWPQSALHLEPVRAAPAPDGVIHVAFAGQINEVRGLKECAAHLRDRSQGRVVLHLFSSDPFDGPQGDAGVLRIEHHGRLSRTDLQARLTQMHFGLVSLHPRLDQPGFPSKTYDYLAAGLPVLYFGRPLPDFVRTLEICGIGVDVTQFDRLDLASLHARMIGGLDAGRRDYLDRNALTIDRIAPLL